MSTSVENRPSRESLRTPAILRSLGQVLAALFIVYTFSMGPAFRIAVSGKDWPYSFAMWKTVYWPFWWLSNTFSIARQPIHWYVELWGQPPEFE